MRSHLLPIGLATSLLFVALPSLAQDKKTGPVEEQETFFLSVDGRITDGTQKLTDCEVLAFEDNERIAAVNTGRTGKFSLLLPIGSLYTLEFRREGFVPKRIVVDTRADVSKALLSDLPLDLMISLLAVDKYNGVDTDVLDYPFAIIKYDKKADAFLEDTEYTRSMQRTNGALLLMGARAEKQE